MSNLTKRILSALVLAPIVLSIIYVGGAVLNITLILVGAIAAYEWHQMTQSAENRTAWIISGAVYILAPLLSLMWLGSFGPGYIYFILLVVWTTDICAYFAGKAIGGPKLAPKISPKKTWAGFFGALAGVSLIAVFVIQQDFAYNTSGYEHKTFIILILFCGLSILSQLGDLFESWVKRHFDVKDSGDLIPGHGGILDRIDGLMFVSPVLALLILLNL